MLQGEISTHPREVRPRNPVQKRWDQTLSYLKRLRTASASKNIEDGTKPPVTINSLEKKQLDQKSQAESLKNRLYSAEFTDDELTQLDKLVVKISTPESSKHEKAPTWDELTPDEKKLLVKRYGQPVKTTRQVRVIGHTSGEGCADNERALPDSFDDRSFGVWDKLLLVYALYGASPHIESASKIRLVPGGLVIGSNGRMLLPDFFYTPSKDIRRVFLIQQINHNPRGDKSLRLADQYVNGALDSDDLVVTVYRQVGSRLSSGDEIANSKLGQMAMEQQGIDYFDRQNLMTGYRQLIEVSRIVEHQIAKIVEESNLLLIKKAFDTNQNIQNVKIRDGAAVVFFIEVGSGIEHLIEPEEMKRIQGAFTAVKDPSWQYGEDSRPMVYKYEYVTDGQLYSKYGYVGNRDALSSTQS